MGCSHTADTSSVCPDSKHSLKTIANKLRQDIVYMVAQGKSGHPGGSLSAADIMATLFFGDVLQYNKQNPLDHTQDRFFLSKGHAAPVLYAVYHQLGWIEDADLNTLRQLGSKLQGHPDCHALPGVEICSGSLGQGLSVACGVALGLKRQKSNNSVYVLLGDGEMQEGSNWEAFMFAAHNKLSNLVAILDLNNLQIDGYVDTVCTLGDIEAKCKAFGWDMLHICGHCTDQIKEALLAAKQSDKPCIVICDTTKGKGVSFMENNAGWHGKAPNKEQAHTALAELKAEIESEGVCG